jgi:S-adenosylmethionine synthetase
MAGKTKQLHEMTDENLLLALADTQKELFALRFRGTTEKLEAPTNIRKHLDLNKPIYARTAAYGHFGRAPDADGGFSWEKTDLVDQLKALV